MIVCGCEKRLLIRLRSTQLVELDSSPLSSVQFSCFALLRSSSLAVPVAVAARGGGGGGVGVAVAAVATVHGPVRTVCNPSIVRASPSN